MPNFMLKKVAIAQGFRLAFPDELGGLPYLAEELPQTAKLSSEELAKDEIVVEAEPSMPQRYPEPPENIAPQEQPPDYDETLVKIEKVESKTGTTNGKPWTAYFIHTATGKYGTFSETIADIASTYAKEGNSSGCAPSLLKRGRKLLLLRMMPHEREPLHGCASS